MTDQRDWITINICTKLEQLLWCPQLSIKASPMKRCKSVIFIRCVDCILIANLFVWHFTWKSKITFDLVKIKTLKFSPCPTFSKNVSKIFWEIWASILPLCRLVSTVDFNKSIFWIILLLLSFEAFPEITTQVCPFVTALCAIVLRNFLILLLEIFWSPNSKDKYLFS